jgi:phosphopentomutase
VVSDRIVSAEIVVRAPVIVLDGAGIGSAGAAEKDGDSGANTLGHVLERTRDLPLPNLFNLGLPELLDGSHLPSSRNFRKNWSRRSSAKMEFGLSAITRGVAPRSLMTSAPNTSEPRIQFFTLPRIPYCRATYEDVISAERLHEICRVARRLADRYRVGRVITRPFLGKAENFQRSTRRHDLSIKPPPTMLNAIADQSLPVISVEKISDILRTKA